MKFKKGKPFWYWKEGNYISSLILMEDCFKFSFRESPKNFQLGFFRTKKAAYQFKKELRKLVKKYWGK